MDKMSVKRTIYTNIIDNIYRVKSYKNDFERIFNDLTKLMLLKV